MAIKYINDKNYKQYRKENNIPDTYDFLREYQFNNYVLTFINFNTCEYIYIYDGQKYTDFKELVKAMKKD